MFWVALGWCCWDVEWFPTNWWDDGRDSLLPWLDDGKIIVEP